MTRHCDVRCLTITLPLRRVGLICDFEPGARDAQQMGALDRRRALRAAQALLRILPVTASARHGNSSCNDTMIAGNIIRRCGAKIGMPRASTNFLSAVAQWPHE